MVHADITLFAAASTTDAVRELAAAFEKETGKKVRLNMAGSGALARQIESGAPADVFISANIKWIDYLEARSLILADSREVIAQSALVLIVPNGSSLKFHDFPAGLNGKLAFGNPASVPAGAYAQEALETAHQFTAVKNSLIKTKDVRTVLMYVERGEVAAGMVYATDAKASGKVKVIHTFPKDSHSPILYSAAACSKKETAFEFLAFLKSDRAKAILKSHGFSVPN